MANVKEIEWQGGIYNIADEVAQGEAQQARALANTAQTTAERALTAAGNAQNAAVAAQDTADDAQITADAAQTAANTAQTAADTAQNTIKSLSNLIFGYTARTARNDFSVTANAPYSFTIPEDGIVNVYYLRKTAGQSLFLKRNGLTVSVVGNYSSFPISGTMFGFFKKGDTVSISTDAPASDEGFLILRAEICY